MTRQTGPVASVTQSPARLPLFLNDARKYIHGADLFDALAAATAADGPVRLRLQRLSDRAVDLRLDPPDLASPSLCGFFEFTEGGRTRHAWLAERAELVTVRSPLMDREAVEGAEFGADNANVRRDPRFSVGKSSVILLVALLERLFPDDTWNLAEMEALSARAPGDTIQVRLTRQIGKFLFATIEADGKAWGQLILASTPYVEDAET